ncbi:hypothetical protein G9A89_014409 [Geosiphon pyriformis]|nr:hypothetical protein G9A89_014409 [Geosiphon pyriformis]
MGEGLGEATSGKTAAILDSSSFPEVKRLENMLEKLSASVLSLMARFDDSILAGDVQVFTFGLESGYLGAGVVIVMNSSLTRHVCKILEVPGQLLFIRLLFKKKLSVLILGLYTGASLVAWFFQAGDINSFIAKTTKFRDNTVANTAIVHDDFFGTRMHSDLDVMWVALYKVLCLYAETVFKKK